MSVKLFSNLVLYVKAEIDTLLGGKSDTSHTHAHADTTGKTANDHHAQLHKSAHATGQADALSPADIGAATSGHSHGAGTGAGFLAFSVYEAIGPYTTDGVWPYSFSLDRTVNLTQYYQKVFVLSPNNGSNYWSIALYKASDLVMPLCAVSTVAINYNTHALLSGTFTASPGTADLGLVVKVTKVGSPGGLYLYNPCVYATW